MGLLLGGLLAVAVPGFILHEAAGAGRHAAGLSAAPFALPRVFAAHLVAVLPLAFVLAGRVRAKWGHVSPLTWAFVGAAVIGLVAYFADDLGDAVAGSEVGPVAALLLRCAVAFLLVFPWIASAGGVTGAPRGSVWVGVLIAVVPAGVFAEAVAVARSKTAAEYLARGRYARAADVVRGLRELGSDTPIGSQSPAAAQKEIDAALGALAKDVARPLPANPPAAARMRRAVALVALNRIDEAVELLAPLTPADPTATLLLATAYQEQERWADSDAAFEAALDRLLPTASSAAARGLCLEAFNGLVLNARAAKRSGDVERILRRGLEVLPSESAHFHFQLGKHFSDGGRPAPALDHLHTAARLDPAKFRTPADDLIRHVRTHTHGCVLPTPSSGGQPASR